MLKIVLCNCPPKGHHMQTGLLFTQEKTQRRRSARKISKDPLKLKNSCREIVFFLKGLCERTFPNRIANIIFTFHFLATTLKTLSKFPDKLYFSCKFQKNPRIFLIFLKNLAEIYWKFSQILRHSRQASIQRGTHKLSYRTAIITAQQNTRNSNSVRGDYLIVRLPGPEETRH